MRLPAAVERLHGGLGLALSLGLCLLVVGARRAVYEAKWLEAAVDGLSVATWVATVWILFCWAFQRHALARARPNLQRFTIDIAAIVAGLIFAAARAPSSWIRENALGYLLVYAQLAVYATTEFASIAIFAFALALPFALAIWTTRVVRTRSVWHRPWVRSALYGVCAFAAASSFLWGLVLDMGPLQILAIIAVFYGADFVFRRGLDAHSWLGLAGPGRFAVLATVYSVATVVLYSGLGILGL